MNVKKLIVLSAALLTVPFSLTGCGPKVTAGGSDTVQVRCYSGGYGTDWLHALAAQFEKTFPGKKIQIVEESSQVTQKFEQEIQSPKSNEIDLYFTNGCALAKLIDASNTVLRTDKKVLLEQLDSVLDSKAIGFDGKEESETIRSRLFDGYVPALQYHGKNTKWQDKVYTLPWADAAVGLFANPKVLSECGIDVNEILTSDDFQEAIETISSFTATKGVFPYAWAGSNAPGYWLFLYMYYFAQYSGVDAFHTFMSCDYNGTGDYNDIKANGYKVFKDEGILKGLEAMYGILDNKYAPPLSESKTHIQAQTYVIDDEAAFIIDGDWILNEMKKDYFDKAKNLIMLPTPIISALGTKIGLNSDDELHMLVKACDASTDDATVISSLAGQGLVVTQEQVSRIREARSIHNVLGITHNIIIPEYADAKETAKLFVRFMYSNDGCRCMRNNAYTNMPLKYTWTEQDTNTTFQQSVDKIDYAGAINVIGEKYYLNDIREKGGLLFFNTSVWAHPHTFSAIMDDKDGSKVLTAQYIYEKEAQYIEQNWSKYF